MSSTPKSDIDERARHSRIRRDRMISIASPIGLVLAVIMGIYRPVRAFVDPLIAATYPIPKSSILPLILLIFGLGEMSKIVMVAIGAFYPIAINATAGVLEINKIYLDVGKNFKAGRWDTFRTIAL